jgi:arginine decarboxylase-like protein
MEAMIKLTQEEKEMGTHSIRTDIEEIIKHQMKDVLSYVDQKTQGIRRELTEKVYEKQLDLQAVKTFLGSFYLSFQLYF